jgi:hypothetical protein
MALITHTYTEGPYTARVFDNCYVEVETEGLIFDRPGPWSTHEGARQWAELIVAKYALVGHLPEEQQA